MKRPETCTLKAVPSTPSKHEHGDSQAFFLDLVVFFCLQDTKFNFFQLQFCYAFLLLSDRRQAILLGTQRIWLFQLHQHGTGKWPGVAGQGGLAGRGGAGGGERACPLGFREKWESLCWAVSQSHSAQRFAEYQALFAGLGEIDVASPWLLVSIYLRLTRGTLCCLSAHNFFKGFPCLQTARIKGYREHGGRNSPVEIRNAVTTFTRLLLGSFFTSVASALSLFPAKSCSTLLLPQGLQPTRLLCRWDFQARILE